MILMMNFNLGFAVSCQTGLEGLNTLGSDILMECFFHSPQKHYLHFTFKIVSLTKNTFNTNVLLSKKILYVFLHCVYSQWTKINATF